MTPSKMGGVLGEHEGLTSEELIHLLISETDERRPRGKAVESFDTVINAIKVRFTELKEYDSIGSMVAGYGSDEFEEGFMAGYSAATKLIIAGLK